jgi:hypothetical protein
LVCSATAVGAVVVTLIVAVVVAAVPLAVTDDGEKAHDASDGSPLHAKLIVPLKPVELETDTDDCPVEPGAEITTVDCDDEIAAEKPGVIVKVCDWVVLLALKLESPL